MRDAASSGRGSEANPKNRFARLECEPLEEDLDPAPLVRTQFFKDDAQSIISHTQSPDVGFTASLNPYRGCEHGCAYCYARPTHEYLGFSGGLDFETKIMVKEKAAELLRKELSAKSWKAEPLAMSTVTDCYQPVERRLGLTRECLEVLAEFHQPVGIITKNHLVTRDIDLLQKLAPHNAAMVHLSITTLDGDLAKKLEPRASPPVRRLAALRELTEAGIRVEVLMAPCIPGLTDHEMPALCAAAREAGAMDIGFIPLRLPMIVAPLFEQWLERHLPGSKDKVLNRIREIRGGKLNDSRFGSRMRGEGFYAEQMHQLFAVAKRKAGFKASEFQLSSASFRVPGAQLPLL